MRRVVWVVAFLALVARAVQRVGWVTPPDPEVTEARWNPLPER